MPIQHLESKRLLLLPWESADWTALKPIATDPMVMRYISDGRPWMDAKITEFVERQRRHYCERGFCLWKLLLKSDTQLAGFCGLQPLDDLPAIEIGWWLARDQWGQGLATEAARVVLDDGFSRIGLTRVVAIAQRENRASTRIMEKLGMRYEGDVEHHGIRVVLYSLEKEEDN